MKPSARPIYEWMLGKGWVTSTDIMKALPATTTISKRLNELVKAGQVAVQPRSGPKRSSHEKEYMALPVAAA